MNYLVFLLAHFIGAAISKSSVVGANLLLGGGFFRVGPTWVNGVREGCAHVTASVVHQVADCVWPIFGKRLGPSHFMEKPGGKEMPINDGAFLRGELRSLCQC